MYERKEILAHDIDTNENDIYTSEDESNIAHKWPKIYAHRWTWLYTCMQV